MDAKLTPEQIPVAERALAQHLLAGPITAAALVAAAARACGHPEGDPCYRFTDRWLQKLRRQGLIAFVREGRSVRWSCTEAGVPTLSGMARPSAPGDEA